MRKRGFTLIEILIVVGIIAILIGIGAFSLAGVRPKARDAKRQTDLILVKAALAQYYADQGFYPTLADLSSPPFTSSDGNPNCKPVITPQCPDPEKVYLQNIPRDPQEKADVHYCYIGQASVTGGTCNNTTVRCNYYLLYAFLEGLPPTGEVCDDGLGEHDVNFKLTPL